MNDVHDTDDTRNNCGGFKQNQKIITAEPGQNATLPCRAPNNSSSISVVEWTRADLRDEYVLLYRDELFDPTITHQSFKNLVKTRNHHKKRANLGGDPISIITLRVVPPDQKIITAEPGQNATLPCRAPNSSSSISIVEWSRADLRDEYVLLYRDELFDPENQHPSFKNRVDLQDRQMKDGDVSLILKDVMINDTGTYECQVFMRGTNMRKRANLVNDPISIITLRVVPPGQTGGDTEDGGKEDGGKEDEGKEDGGKEDGSVGLKAGLSVLALLLVAAVVGFLIYRKHKQQHSPDSYQPPVTLQPV